MLAALGPEIITNTYRKKDRGGWRREERKLATAELTYNLNTGEATTGGSSRLAGQLVALSPNFRFGGRLCLNNSSQE